MIFRLMSEQTDEDEHKHWCDAELSKTQAMKDTKDNKVQELAAKLQAETTDVAQLTQEVQDANTMINSIVASMEEATRIRNIGKTENMAAIADAEAAQKAILGAIDALESFYKDSGMIQEDSAFLEVP